jgi:hypothetical protein
MKCLLDGLKSPYSLIQKHPNCFANVAAVITIGALYREVYRIFNSSLSLQKCFDEAVNQNVNERCFSELSHFERQKMMWYVGLGVVVAIFTPALLAHSSSEVKRICLLTKKIYKTFNRKIFVPSFNFFIINNLFFSNDYRVIFYG